MISLLIMVLWLFAEQFLGYFQVLNRHGVKKMYFPLSHTQMASSFHSSALKLSFKKRMIKIGLNLLELELPAFCPIKLDVGHLDFGFHGNQNFFSPFLV